jgi:hypothetical protein
MEANAIATFFTNNLEIDENVEAKTDSNPSTFVLNIIKECLQQPNIQANSSLTTFVFNIANNKINSTTKYSRSFNFKFCTFHNKTTTINLEGEYIH